MARLLSLNVGPPRQVPWNGRIVRTAIWKLPIEGRRIARKLNIDGDVSLIRTQRDRRELEPKVREPPGAGRSLRRSGQMVMPYRSLPHLHDGSDCRLNSISTGTT